MIAVDFTRWIRVLGLFLAVTAFILWYIARLQLGIAFTLVPEANMMVKTGLFRLFSHPVYLFSALSLIGFYLLTRKTLLLGIFVTMVPIQLYRIKVENEVMRSQFGSAYSNHIRDTWV